MLLQAFAHPAETARPATSTTVPRTVPAIENARDGREHASAQTPAASTQLAAMTQVSGRQSIASITSTGIIPCVVLLANGQVKKQFQPIIEPDPKLARTNASRTWNSAEPIAGRVRKLNPATIGVSGPIPTAPASGTAKAQFASESPKRPSIHHHAIAAASSTQAPARQP